MQKKVAVLLWLYHIDRWSLIKPLLEPIKDKISLFAGVCSDTCPEALYTEVNEFCDKTDGKLSYFKNIGKELNSFLYQISELDEKKYPIFIKLHSQKKHLSNRYSVPWLEYLLNDIVGHEETFINNVGEFYRNTECGMIANSFLKIDVDQYYSENQQLIDKLCDSMGIDINYVDYKSFIGGSIFMSRTDIFKRHITKKFADSINNLFQKDTEINNDKLLKSMEMIFGYLPIYYKLKILPSKLTQIYTTEDKNINIIKAPNDTVYIQQIPFIWGEIIEQTSESMSVKWKSIFIDFVPQKILLKENNKLSFSGN